MFKLKLKNYRGFLDEEFDFSRINILIGENSAGKSSIFKFLLALKQSFRSPNNKDYNLAFSGEETNLGNYQEVIFNHETKRDLFFSFEFTKDYFDYFLNYWSPLPRKRTSNKTLINKASKNRKEVIKTIGGNVSTPIIISFELTKDLSKHSNISTKIYNETFGEIEIITPDDETQVEQDIFFIDKNLECEIRFHSKEFNKTFIFQNVAFEKLAFLSIVHSGSLNEKVKALKVEDSEKLFNQLAFLLIAQNYVVHHITGIEYINPLLSKPPARLYFEEDRKSTRRIRDIKDLLDFLDTNNTKPLFKQKLLSILSDFGIADEIEIRKRDQTRELRIILNKINNNILDVGFGVSLQLPIFAQAIISEGTTAIREDRETRTGETLLIEQPEVHLHPKLQAKFIDILLGLGSNNIYFIETHSEHIIRMLQILIKEKKYSLKSEDISIHYFKKDGKKIVTSEHKIDDKTGKLAPSFPKGFYDVSYDLAFQLMD